jgi:hypothetical protein
LVVHLYLFLLGEGVSAQTEGVMQHKQQPIF